MSYGWGSQDWSQGWGSRDDAADAGQSWGGGGGWSAGARWGEKAEGESSRSDGWGQGASQRGAAQQGGGWGRRFEEAPRREHVALGPSRGQNERISGKVKDWNGARGFGFVSCLDADYFLHHSSILGEGFKALAEGEVVEFEVETNPSTGKLQAVKVTAPGGSPLQGSERPPGKGGRGRGRGKGRGAPGREDREGGQEAGWSWSPGDGKGRAEGKTRGEKGGSRGPRPNTVFVAGLSWNTAVEDVREHFEQVGEVTDAYVATDRETGKSRGFGKVSFASHEQMVAAIEKLNESDLDGRSITVRQDNPPPPKGEGKGSADDSVGSKGSRSGMGGKGGEAPSWPREEAPAATAGVALLEGREEEEEEEEEEAHVGGGGGTPEELRADGGTGEPGGGGAAADAAAAGEGAVAEEAGAREAGPPAEAEGGAEAADSWKESGGWGGGGGWSGGWTGGAWSGGGWGSGAWEAPADGGEP